MEKFSWVENYNKIIEGKIQIEYCSSLRKLILKNNLFEYKCNCCNIRKWNELPITLEIEHKDGNRLNNSKENLELLCPNCHSQTSTYRKNRGDKIRTIINEDKVLEIFNECENINQLLLKLEASNSGGNYKRIQKILDENKLIFNNDIININNPKSQTYISKKNMKNKIEKYKQLIIETHIDFRYKNWGVEVAKILNKSPQWSLKFVQRHLPYLLEVERPIKKSRDEIKKELIYKIENSEINFNNKKWRSQLSKTTGKTNWYLKTFIEENLPNIWEQCYK